MKNAPHFQTYHRVLSRAIWSSLHASGILMQQLIRVFAPSGVLVMGIDDTIERRWGKRIAARGIYRDPVRSSDSHFVKTSGLRWLSLMLLVEIKKGQTTALVGSSGAGKTTLAALVPRFYDPTQGQVLLDGVDLASFEISSLRQRIAIVSQDTFIFNASVRENITYGTAGASEEEIWRVAKLANALDFILELPRGFDSQLGDRGANLSGGQRQRISIARALLRDPEILILDEATSALDSVSEQLIQAALEKLSINRTVIAIAHRLSTIAHADKVVVLEQGRVVEQGSYQDLLKQKGKLWQYYQVQFNNGVDRVKQP